MSAYYMQGTITGGLQTSDQTLCTGKDGETTSLKDEEKRYLSTQNSIKCKYTLINEAK